VKTAKEVKRDGRTFTLITCLECSNEIAAKATSKVH